MHVSAGQLLTTAVACTVSINSELETSDSSAAVTVTEGGTAEAAAKVLAEDGDKDGGEKLGGGDPAGSARFIELTPMSAGAALFDGREAAAGQLRNHSSNLSGQQHEHGHSELWLETYFS